MTPKSNSDELYQNLPGLCLGILLQESASSALYKHGTSRERLRYSMALHATRSRAIVLGDSIWKLVAS